MAPSPESDLIRINPPPGVSIALEPATNVLNSALLLAQVEKLSGLDEWVTRTAATLSPERYHLNRLVMEGLFLAVQPDRRWPSFPLFVEDMARRDPVELRDRLLFGLTRKTAGWCGPDEQSLPPVDPYSLLTSVEAYLAFLDGPYFGHEYDPLLETEAYGYFVDPPRMQELIVSHLRTMWREHLAHEWERVRPMLEDSARAFQQLSIATLTPAEALRSITGQEPSDKWERILSGARQVVFVPSAHMGPYLSKFQHGEVLWVMFGARLPEGVRTGSSPLGRSELLVRLGALNDDTRLRILALLGKHGDLFAQEIMVHLDLTQSAASRHLRQLSATGYLIERWSDGAKRYSLNRNRIQETFGALERFLDQA